MDKDSKISNLNKLIESAKENRKSQNMIYKLYAPKMLGVCRQYIKDIHFAEDVMIEGFIKVFKNIESFKGEGSFEGWIRRIMINQSISFYREESKIKFDELSEYNAVINPEIGGDFFEDQIQEIIDQLPGGYRVVFLLYTVEQYKHKEIAEKLNISISTSKSQLFKARKALQKVLNKEIIFNHE